MGCKRRHLGRLSKRRRLRLLKIGTRAVRRNPAPFEYGIRSLSDKPSETRSEGELLANKPQRADPRRNRERLLEVAAEAFTRDGISASLEDIAREAGVGMGTLYRHFPTREHLVEVLYRREVEALCEAAEELARRHPADIALAEWMQRFVGYIAAKRGMAASLRILFETNSELFAAASGKVPVALRRLVDAAASK